MALSKPTLASEIKAQIILQYGPADDDATLVKFCTAIANAVVDHIKNNAQVVTSTPNAQGGTSTLPGTGTVT